METAINFKCNQCPYEFKNEKLDVPSPNYFAASTANSYNSSIEVLTCPDCSTNYEIRIMQGPDDTSIEIDGYLDEDISYNQSIDDEFLNAPEFDSYSQIYDEFKISMGNIDVLINDIQKFNLMGKSTFIRMLHIQIITTLETYFKDTYEYFVLKDEEFLQKFIKKDDDLKKRKLSDILNERTLLDGLIKIVKDKIDKRSFHKIEYVCNIYRDTFNIEMRIHDWLMQAITTRHNCVHRNGKNKNGELEQISVENISDLKNKIMDYLNLVHESLLKIGF